MLSHVLFFFSSRRRHTRFDCDWSSDVCSSDLLRARHAVRGGRATGAAAGARGVGLFERRLGPPRPPPGARRRPGGRRPLAVAPPPPGGSVAAPGSGRPAGVPPAPPPPRPPPSGAAAP